MLPSDLTVIDNASVTNIGGAGSLTFAQVFSDLTGSVRRRVAATAGTTPQVIDLSHSQSGKGYGLRTRTLIKATYTAANVDTTTTGGIVPSASAYLVLDRPMNMGAIITDQILKNLVGQVIGVLVPSGQFAKILNLES
jgi:hypothetical protein